MKKFDTTLYFITDSTGLEENVFLYKVEQALSGGVTIIQLREKNKSTREYMHLAEKVHEISAKYGVPLIIDDRIDIANKTLLHQVNARHLSLVLNPKVVVLVEINMIMSEVFWQGEIILSRRVNVYKVGAIVAVDMSNSCYHHTASFRTLDSLCTIICQTMRGIIREEHTFHPLSMQHTAYQQQQCCGQTTNYRVFKHWAISKL